MLVGHKWRFIRGANPMAKPEKKRRGARGTGTIFFSKSRRVWIGRVPAGGQTTNGHTRYREMWDPNQTNLVKRLKELRPPGPTTTVRQWSKRWIELSTARDSTRDGYAYTLSKFILPTLGHIRVAALTTHQCEAALKQWQKRIGPGTARVYLGQLRNMLNAARRAGLCQANPAREVRTPRAPRRKLAPIDPPDLQRIIKACLGKPADWPVALLAATGMRVGEALALDVPDWNPDDGTITISKTWTRRHGTRPPKSEQGNRTIRVPLSARPALTRAAGKRDSGPLFVVWGGRNRRYHESVRQAFDAVQRRLGLPRRNLHQLRHSAGSALVAAGESLSDVAEYLGDRVETIVSTYLHPTKRDPSLAMDRLLGGREVGDRKKKTRKQG